MLSQPIIILPAAFTMLWFIMISPCHNLHFCGGINTDVDVFGKPVNDTVSFRERRSSFELEIKTAFLQTMQNMHDPIIFLNQTDLNSLLTVYSPQKLFEFRVIMKILRHGLRPLLTATG